MSLWLLWCIPEEIFLPPFLIWSLPLLVYPDQCFPGYIISTLGASSTHTASICQSAGFARSGWTLRFPSHLSGILYSSQCYQTASPSSSHGNRQSPWRLFVLVWSFFNLWEHSIVQQLGIRSIQDLSYCWLCLVFSVAEGWFLCYLSSYFPFSSFSHTSPIPKMNKSCSLRKLSGRHFTFLLWRIPPSEQLQSVSYNDYIAYDWIPQKCCQKHFKVLIFPFCVR